VITLRSRLSRQPERRRVAAAWRVVASFAAAGFLACLISALPAIAADRNSAAAFALEFRSAVGRPALHSLPAPRLGDRLRQNQACRSLPHSAGHHRGREGWQSKSTGRGHAHLHFLTGGKAEPGLSRRHSARRRFDTQHDGRPGSRWERIPPDSFCPVALPAAILTSLPLGEAGTRGPPRRPNSMETRKAQFFFCLTSAHLPEAHRNIESRNPLPGKIAGAHSRAVGGTPWGPLFGSSARAGQAPPLQHGGETPPLQMDSNAGQKTVSEVANKNFRPRPGNTSLADS
jgi:hypothetical protein